MRFLKSNKNYKFNLKYALGEIFLLFIGISLAIWFNNWNTSNKTNKAKELVIVKIKEEIENNLEELVIAQAKNELVGIAFSEYKKIFNGATDEVITTPKHLDSLRKSYPGFYTITDSTEVDHGVFKYKGGTYIQLEIFDLTQIAWETTRSINITNEFDYECLYEFESIYNLQRLVLKEIDKAANALQRGQLNELMNIINFMNQLNPQLIESYEEMLATIDDCR